MNRDPMRVDVEGAARRLLRFCALLGAAAFAAGCAAATDGACRAPARTEAVEIKRVVDGDTVTLADGRSLRLIGVNAPERGRRGGVDDPLAAAAETELGALLRPGGLRFEPGREAFDRHGRSLGDLYLADGRLVAQELVRRGLGFAVAVPPNDLHIACLLAAEADARRAGRGVWRDPSPWTFAAARPPAGVAGKFRRATGAVSARHERRGGLALDLDGQVELWIPAERRAALDPVLAGVVPGSRLTVRGWWGSYRGRPSLRLTHPSQVESGR